MVIVWNILGGLALLASVALFARAAQPLALIVQGISPALIELEAILGLLIAVICFLGANLLAVLQPRTPPTHWYWERPPNEPGAPAARRGDV